MICPVSTSSGLLNSKVNIWCPTAKSDYVRIILIRVNFNLFPPKCVHSFLSFTHRISRCQNIWIFLGPRTCIEFHIEILWWMTNPNLAIITGSTLENEKTVAFSEQKSFYTLNSFLLHRFYLKQNISEKIKLQFCINLFFRKNLLINPRLELHYFVQ